MDENTLVEQNMGLVYSQLHKFKLINDDDALSYAMEALLIAVRTFDDSKGIKLSTYATVCIYNALSQYTRRRGRKRVLTVISYNEPVNEDAEWIDLLGTPTTPEDDYIKKEQYARLRKAFFKVYNSLPEGNPKRIVTLWYKAGFICKQADIAREVNTTQSNVSKALSAFRYKVKKEMEDY